MAKGGRGGKRRSSNPNSGNGNYSNAPGDRIADTLDEALGVQGSPMSIEKAWFDTNPYYSDDYNEFSANCQRCVFALEMRQRGYDVEALPTYKGDKMPMGGNWLKAMSGITQVNVGKTTERATIKSIEKQMSDWGDGSRAIIRLKWAGSNSGHVINAEYKNGKLNVYDGQSVKRVTGVQYLKDYLPYTTLSKTELFRVDNAKPTDTMRYMVKQKKK